MERGEGEGERVGRGGVGEGERVGRGGVGEGGRGEREENGRRPVIRETEEEGWKVMKGVRGKGKCVSPVTKRVDEVEAAVDAMVLNVPPVET